MLYSHNKLDVIWIDGWQFKLFAVAVFTISVELSEKNRLAGIQMPYNIAATI